MIEYRGAKRTNAKPIIGLYSESGDGKTYSALLLARGFVGPKGKIAMIETESGRGEALADDPVFFGDAGAPGYDVISLRDDFSPKAYNDALKLAEKNKVNALLIDSASHEWEGAGGVLDMAAERAKTMKGVLIWQKPKIDHSRLFMLPLLQTPIDLVIVCMRAKYPMEQTKNSKGETEWTRSKTLEPKQSDDILFEMFLHGWLDKEHKFHGTKYTINSLRDVIKDNEPITLETGKRLAAWAKGDAPVKTNGAASTTTAIKSDFEFAADQAKLGTVHLKEWMNAATRKEFRKRLAPRFEELLKIAAEADKAPKTESTDGNAEPDGDKLL